MRNVTWAVLVERGAANPTWSRSACSLAFSRIGRYFAINPIQTATNPWLRVVITHQSKASNGQPWAAWTSGRTVYIPARFRYHSLAQLVFVLVHEFGHVFGGGKHVPKAGHVMSAEIRDVYRNFTQEDYKWFRSLGVRPATQVPRAYDEPDHWKPRSAAELRQSMQELAEGWQCTVDELLEYAGGSVGWPGVCCGHASFWDRVRDWVTPKAYTIQEVERELF